MAIERPASHIVIAGGGFAGLRLARLLARNGPRRDAAGRPVRVTLIDRQRAFTYTPLLYEVAAGKIAPEHASTPYRDLLWDRSVAVRQTTITGFDLERRVVQTDSDDIPYDRLVLAVGAASTLPRGSDGSGLTAHAIPFMNLSDARAIRTTLAARFRAAAQASENVTIAVAGGGAKGVELIFDLADFTERRLASAYGIARDQIRLVLVNGDGRLMADLPAYFDHAARAAMRERGIRLIQQRLVVGADDARVRLDDGGTIAARTLIWTAGITAHPLVRALGLPLTDGALRVTPSLQLPGFPAVYAAGDAVWMDNGAGGRRPATASLAQQQGRFLARALAADVAGEPLPTFHDAPRGQIIKLGDGNAIAQLGGGPHAPHFTGRAAHALRGGLDLLETPGIARKRDALRDLLRPQSSG
ncbi:MAG: FAD-dependent oxidoreductase [Chloroflexota bacterium]|nr:FAD-dependent oxidoreductase [Chloroflexota bacterium]